MTKDAFSELIRKRIVYLDGATGTNLQKAGMPAGVCPEQWILQHPETLISLQREFVGAGTDILYAPTFTANRVKLQEYGLADRIEEMNRELVGLSKEAAGPETLIAGDMSMTGVSLEPMGPMKLTDLIRIYREQAEILDRAGVDLYIVETMMSLAECRAAVLGIREASDKPVMATLTFEEDGRTLYGTTPEAAVTVLQSLGVSAVGVNCSSGPDRMVEIVRRMKAYANIPVIAKPNNGMPELADGKTVYRTSPEEFASFGPALVEAGASLLGGCCGTTPAHIRALAEKTKDLTPPVIPDRRRSVLASERTIREIDVNGEFLIIGERINPTGKKKLQAELKAGSTELVMQMAEEQEEAGAEILDINMGMGGIDEHAMMLRVLEEVGSASNLPLCIDSSHADIIEDALLHYPGRALINSISLEKAKFERLLPAAKKYGAMFILLPLSDAGLPATAEEKIRIIETIRTRAHELGLTDADMVVDGLVSTVGANPRAGIETLETIRYCRNEGLATSVGLSNISFGLPERSYVNAAFRNLAVKAGLTMAIANPSTVNAVTDERAEDRLALALAEKMLMNEPGASENYIDCAAVLKEKKELEKAFESGVPAVKRTDADVPAQAEKKTESAVYTSVLKGRDRVIVSEIQKELDSGAAADEIIDRDLIPAINEVGLLFEKKRYFLPQLMASAEAMRVGIDYLEPMLTRKSAGENQAVVVIATVEGDIHDIGKNLVALMLKNYGFRVIDLGKDVPKQVILDTARREKADIIALSALMTTTMMRMKDVVDLKNREKLPVKVIVGGAAVTESFAAEIGADGYSENAAECVKLVKRLTAK